MHNAEYGVVPFMAQRLFCPIILYTLSQHYFIVFTLDKKKAILLLYHRSRIKLNSYYPMIFIIVNAVICHLMYIVDRIQC